MKKLLFSAGMFLFFGTSIFAQKDSKAIGVNLSYGTRTESVGLGVKGQYFFTDNLRGEASFDYFFSHDNVSMWDLNANAHYVFNISEKFKIYPLLGFTMTSWATDYKIYSTNKEGVQVIKEKTDHTVRFGANYGGGIEYALSSGVSATAEIKEQVLSSSSQAVFSIGLKARF